MILLYMNMDKFSDRSSLFPQYKCYNPRKTCKTFISQDVIWGAIFVFVFQLSRREISLQQYEADLAQVKQQYREAVEENGRLEARIQAFAINAQSEQDVLSSEVLEISW